MRMQFNLNWFAIWIDLQFDFLERWKTFNRIGKKNKYGVGRFTNLGEERGTTKGQLIWPLIYCLFLLQFSFLCLKMRGMACMAPPSPLTSATSENILVNCSHTFANIMRDSNCRRNMAFGKSIWRMYTYHIEVIYTASKYTFVTVKTWNVHRR